MPQIKLKNGQVKSWDVALIMGVINCGPDSYYLSSTEPSDNLKLADQMLTAGADILDLGAMSSKPGSDIISAEQDWQRLEPHLRLIRETYTDALISVDTVHAEVAQKAIDMGADIINDISFGNIDTQMFETVCKAEVPYIGMHMQGIPSTMQDSPEYTDVVREVHDYLSKRAALSQIPEDKIILDIGIGFGKTIDQNFELLAALDSFASIGPPLLVGISRKSLLYKLLDTSPHEMLAATSALHMYTLQQGADILRVHDVQEASEVVILYNQIQRSKNL